MTKKFELQKRLMMRRRRGKTVAKSYLKFRHKILTVLPWLQPWLTFVISIHFHVLKPQLLFQIKGWKGWKNVATKPSILIMLAAIQTKIEDASLLHKNVHALHTNCKFSFCNVPPWAQYWFSLKFSNIKCSFVPKSISPFLPLTKVWSKLDPV